MNKVGSYNVLQYNNNIKRNQLSYTVVEESSWRSDRNKIIYISSRLILSLSLFLSLNQNYGTRLSQVAPTFDGIFRGCTFPTFLSGISMFSDISRFPLVLLLTSDC